MLRDMLLLWPGADEEAVPPVPPLETTVRAIRTLAPTVRLRGTPAPVPDFWPENPRTWVIDIEASDPSSDRVVPVTSGSVTAFISSDGAPDTTPADPSLSVSCLHIGHGSWRAHFPRSVMALSVLRTLFGRTIVGDNFTRANSSAGLGTAETGQPWSTIEGTVGIRSGRAYVVTLSGRPGAMAVIDAGASNLRVSATMKVAGDASLVVRHGGTSSPGDAGVSVDMVAGTVELNVVGVGTFGTQPYTPVAGDRIALEAEDDVVRVYINGALRIQQSGLLASIDNTRVALGWSGLGLAEWDELLVERTAPTPYLIIDEAGGVRAALPLRYQEERQPLTR